MTFQTMAQFYYSKILVQQNNFLSFSNAVQFNIPATTISNTQQSKFHQMKMKEQNQFNLVTKKYQRSKDQQQFFIQQHGKYHAIKVSPDEDGDETPIQLREKAIPAKRESATILFNKTASKTQIKFHQMEMKISFNST